jgi:hypothetical protein
MDKAVDDLEDELNAEHFIQSGLDKMENPQTEMHAKWNDLREIRDELLKNLDKQSMIGAEGGGVPSLDKEIFLSII